MNSESLKPLKEARSVALASAVSRPESAAPKSRRALNILVVDDFEMNRKVLRVTLEAEGHGIFEANDGVEALGLLQGQPIDLIISDILMPNMDGYRLCYEIRSSDQFRFIPIIFCTATFTSPGDERFALDIGADRYLKKPASGPEILAAITEITAKAKPDQERLRRQLGEGEMVKQYNEVLINKLEAKNLELTERTERLQQAEEQLRLMASRLDAVREEEATSISRELHDELGQALTALNIDLHWVQARTREVENEPLRCKMLERVTSMLAAVESTVRSVQRICADLRPSMLDHLGLLATLEWLVEDFGAHTEVPCEWKAKPQSLLLDPVQSTALFRIFREALTNIARHAKPQRVTIRLEQNSGGTLLHLTDDGKGFSVAGLTGPASLGLTGMRERAMLVGGTLEIESAPGRGTTVSLRIPVQTHAHSDRR